MNQSVNRLVRKGHSLKDIGDYTLGQFSMFLDAAMQLDASDRASFVTDVSVVLGSLFAGGKNSPSAEHVDLLIDAAAGVKNG